jgi:hypothetical protein
MMPIRITFRINEDEKAEPKPAFIVTSEPVHTVGTEQSKLDSGLIHESGLDLDFCPACKAKGDLSWSPLFIPTLSSLLASRRTACCSCASGEHAFLDANPRHVANH